MTREEIIGGLKFTVEMFMYNPSTGEKYTEPRNDLDKTTIDACRGAIKLLERESAHWTEDFICSNCRCKCYPMDIDFGNYNYCPNCGREMEEGD